MNIHLTYFRHSGGAISSICTKCDKVLSQGEIFMCVVLEKEPYILCDSKKCDCGYSQLAICFYESESAALEAIQALQNKIFAGDIHDLHSRLLEGQIVGLTIDKVGGIPKNPINPRFN